MVKGGGVYGLPPVRDAVRAPAGGEAQVRRQVPQPWRRRLRGRVDRLEQGASVPGAALPGIVAGLAAAIEEGPVARLHGEQLAHRALDRRPGHRAVEAPQHAQLQPPRGPGHVGDGGRVPGAQVLALAPGRWPQRSRLARVPLAGLAERDQLDPVLAGRRPGPARARSVPPTTSGRAARCRSRTPAALGARARRRRRAGGPRRRRRTGVRAPGRAARRAPGRTARPRSTRGAIRAATCGESPRTRDRRDSRRATRARRPPPSRS